MKSSRLEPPPIADALKANKRKAREYGEQSYLITLKCHVKEHVAGETQQTGAQLT